MKIGIAQTAENLAFDFKVLQKQYSNKILKHLLGTSKLKGHASDWSQYLPTLASLILSSYKTEASGVIPIENVWIISRKQRNQKGGNN